ncbi:MAG: acyl-CoA thioesterase [Lentisphaeria bacterium]|nr:acyl-CoA thioesterase [Lentisphaeria bacterium]
MEMFTLVRPEHLNHYGNLFGGQLLKWVDEYAYLAALREYPGETLVTRAMDHVDFTRGVPVGALLRLHIVRAAVGVSSVRYHVTVYAQECGAVEEVPVFETTVTFVCVDRKHRRKPLPEAAAGVSP